MKIIAKTVMRTESGIFCMKLGSIHIFIPQKINMTLKYFRTDLTQECDIGPARKNFAQHLKITPRP